MEAQWKLEVIFATVMSIIQSELKNLNAKWFLCFSGLDDGVPRAARSMSLTMGKVIINSYE